MARQQGPWAPEDDETKGENYTYNARRCYELGLHLTFGANGQIVVIKHRVKRGVSETIYKWTGAQPQLPPKAERTEH